MKKRNLIIIIATLILTIIILTIAVFLNKDNNKKGAISVELESMMKKFDIRLNANQDEYYIYGLKPQGKFENYTLEIPDTVDGIPITEIHDATDFIKYQDHMIRIIKLGKNVNYIIGNAKSDSFVNPYGENIFLNATTVVSIEVSNENKTFASYNGVLFNKDFTILLKYPNSKTAITDDASSNYTIPSTTEEIYNHAFYNHNFLETITFGEKVTKVGKEAFANCTKLSSIQFNSNVEEIDNRAFMGCSNLKSINLPKRLNKLSRGLFSRCINLESIYLPSSLFTESCFEEDVFTGCSHINKIYTDEENYNVVCQIIRKYPVFANLSDEQITKLVVIREIK